jgi:tRNA pseudouridine13 synthase
MGGTVVHLTNQSVVKYVESNETVEGEEVEVLTADQWKSVERMIKTGDPKVVEIDVTEKSKELRQAIHKCLRVNYEDDNITSNSEPVDGKTIMKIFKMEGEEEKRRNDQRRMSSVYTQFVLYKENLSTMEAINTIARVLK